MGPTLFPTRDADFNSYVIISIPYLDTNKVRLLISAGNVTAMLALKVTWDDIFPKSQDPNQRTTTITDNKNDARADIEDLLRSIYADIPASVLTTDDRNTLNLHERDTTPTPRPAITTSPVAKLSSGPGARIDVTCRVDNDSSRASIHPDADGVEMAYIVGTTPPASPAACNRIIVSSKAKFTVQADMAEAGKKLFAYMRWKNNTSEDKSGPWTSMLSATVAD
jgi:hypothetical protein